MTPDLIIAQLQANLPRSTTLFSTFFTGASASVDGGTITVNAPSHGMTAGSLVNIPSGTTRNMISAYEVPTGADYAVFTLSAPHDYSTNYTTEVTIAGSGTVWDGTHKLRSVNRTKIALSLPENPTDPTGGYAVEDRALGVKGVYPITTILDADTFSIQFPASFQVPSYPSSVIDNFSCVKAMRIYGAASLERAEAFYSMQFPELNVPALFVVMTDTTTSKNRTATTDAKVNAVPGTILKLFRIGSFSTVAFIPTASDASGFNAQQLCYGVIDSALLRSLYGGLTANGQNRAVPEGSGPGVYNTAYYSHVWNWELEEQLDYSYGFNWDDGIDVQDLTFKGTQSAAVKTISANLFPFNDPYAEVSLKIDLPES